MGFPHSNSVRHSRQLQSIILYDFHYLLEHGRVNALGVICVGAQFYLGRTYCKP